MKKSPRKTWLFIVAFVILLGIAGYYTDMFGLRTRWLESLSAEQMPIHIALVIPEKAADSYPEQENVGKLFEKQVNDAGGVNGHPIQIDFYYDGDDTAGEAATQAQKIVKDNRAVVVIGHRKSPGSMAVVGTYEAAGIPSINATASTPEITLNHPWAFRVITNTTELGRYAALYAQNVLGHDRASIIYVDDEFGRSLHDSFKATFEKSGTVVYDIKMPKRYATVDEAALNDMRGIMAQLSQQGDAGIVFLAVVRNEGQAFITVMRQQKKSFPILASYGMGDPHFASLFDDPAYPNGMVAMSLLNYDLAGEQAQIFYNAYTTRYKNSTPSWLGGTTYDALQVALEAIRATQATGAPGSLKAERKKIKDYLASLNNPNKAMDGVTGQVYFDSQRNFSQPPTFGVFQNGDFIAAPIQLHPVQNKKLISELTDDVIVDGSQYIYKTNVVYTGIRINEISEVDVDRAHAFTADFYIWFRYQGDLDIGTLDFLNAVAPVRLDAPVVSSAQDGINYRLYRVRAQFHTTFDLQNYPFDKQELAILFRHHTLTREKLIYVEDGLGMDQITHARTYSPASSPTGCLIRLPIGIPPTPGFLSPCTPTNPRLATRRYSATGKMSKTPPSTSKWIFSATIRVLS